MSTQFIELRIYVFHACVHGMHQECHYEHEICTCGNGKEKAVSTTNHNVQKQRKET